MSWPYRLLVTVLLLGCAASQALTVESRRQQWAGVWQRFNEASRWQRHHEAGNWIAEELRDRYLERFAEQTNELRILDTELLDVVWDDDSTVATVKAAIRYTQLPSLNEERAIVSQRWETRTVGWCLASIRQLPQGGPLDLN